MLPRNIKKTGNKPIDFANSLAPFENMCMQYDALDLDRAVQILYGHYLVGDFDELFKSLIEKSKELADKYKTK